MKTFIGGLCMAVLLSAAGDSRLSDAAMQGDRDAVRSLLAQKVDVNAPQGDGTTALHWAAYKDDVEMAKMLLAAGASVKAATRIGAITPLFMASKNGSAPMIEILLKAGADANATDEHGTTALMTAAASGSTEAVKLLIDHGADVNAKEGTHGQTALMFAAALNRDAAIRILLEHGADPSITSKPVKLPPPGPRFDDGNPVPEAKEEKPAATAGKESATDQKAALDALASSLGFKSAVYTAGKSEDAPADLKTMVQKLSAKVDEMEKRLPGDKSKGEDGNNSMYGIIRERGTLDMGGLTALLYAARDGHMDAAKALLEGGANINEVSASEKTSPLVMATMNGHFDLAKLFVDWSADPNLANNQGLTALYAAVDLQWAPKGWFPAPGVGQEKVTYLNLMKVLLETGANPNARITKKLWFRSFGDHSWVDAAGATAFWRAAQSSDLDAMRLLVDHGADPDLPTTHGTTPLMAAAGIGWGYHYSMNAPDSWMEAVKYCVQHGADVNAADDRGYTALHGAAYLGNHEMISYLIEKGADVKAVAKDKNTVADMANGPTRFGIPHPETVAMLEKLGSANSHNCRSDQCLVAPKEAKKPGDKSQ
ncbi:MAG TPA: ankyrin repeat domain-containing protein [Bryobacteraceae bacterium]|nr:ankyrin repeat domain-containing protein [Bryobacteraceae bacterium]